MSTLLDQASLVLIPSGYKEDIVYSQKPTDGSGDLTFTRASDGTRVNSAGYVENVPWNLVQNSEDFSAIWNAQNSTITTNSIVAPNGTTTADSLIGANSSAAMGVYVAETTSVVKTFSCYVKKGSKRWAVLLGYNGVSNCWFDLDNGVVGTRGSNYSTSSITSVGNGWFRIDAVMTTAIGGNANIGIYASDNDNSIVCTGDGTTVLSYIWGAQVNQGTLKPYFPTTDRQNVPRLTYEGGCPSLLLEPQRTNDVFPSEDFSGYSGSGATISTNQAVSPDGTQNADLMYPATSGNFAGKYKNVAATTTGVVSCFVKQAGKRYAIVGTDNNATYTCIFDLQTSTVVYEATNYTGSIEALSNGWYRISAVYTSSTAAAYPFIGVADNSSGGVVVDGTNGIYIWGFQYERNVSYLTSYIPTTSAAVTRVADAAYKTGISSLIGQTEGTLYVEIERKQYDAQAFWVNISDNSYNNWIFVGWDGFNSRNYIRVGNTVYADGGIGNMPVGRYKIAISYKSGDSAAYVNGVQAWADSDTWTLSGLNTLNIGGAQPVAGGMLSSGSLNQAVLFKTRLTNAELASLTTL